VKSAAIRGRANFFMWTPSRLRVWWVYPGTTQPVRLG
jgi:hypothetical protein